MFGSLDISASGLVAQRTRMNVISSNLANVNTIYDAEGNYAPFRRRIAVFESGDPSTDNRAGVHVAEFLLDEGPLRKVYEPGNPNADANMEQINALEASRAYEANITAAEATKAMIRESMRLLA